MQMGVAKSLVGQEQAMIGTFTNRAERQIVVLVHGLAANRLVMGALARSLGKAFAATLNWGYRSLWSPIQQHSRELAALLRGLDQAGEHDRIHLVAHSMGGIIGRLALAEYQPERFGRFVMIAPPNRGSHIAAHLAPYLGRICPPLVQLANHDRSFVCSLPPPAIEELGIIAAKTDFLVLEPNTRLGCERDHIVLPGLHSSLLWRPETAVQVGHFLKYGQFHREPCPVECHVIG
jgi:pimeloyl-ACP methyl ester carboxylesterase